MSFFNEYPSTNFHELNADWILNEIKQMREIIDTKLDSYIRAALDKMFINSMYDAETETLILILDMEE